MPFLLVAAACTSGCVRSFPLFDDGAAPQALAYAPNPAVYNRNIALSASTPQVQGGAPSRFSVEPALPLGISLDPFSGTLSGTPSQVAETAVYRITAANEFGASSTELTLTVYETPPLFVFASDSYRFVRGRSQLSVVPTNIGGRPSSCGVTADSPPLPAGLRVEPRTCAITGTPTEVAALSVYTLGATYENGEARVQVGLEVVDSVRLLPARATLPAFSDITLPFSAMDGVPPYTYEIASGTASIDANTGLYTASSDIGTITVRVTDATGGQSTASIRQVRRLVAGDVASVTSTATHAYIGGAMARVEVLPAGGVMALDKDSGAPIYSFDVGDGFDGGALSLSASADEVFVSGRFLSYQGRLQSGLAKISAHTGLLDGAFPKGLVVDDDVVQHLTVAESVFLLGTFSTYGGTPRPRLAKIAKHAGVLDEAFVPPSSLATATPVALASDGNALYVASSSGVVKLSLDTGALDTAFNADLGGGAPVALAAAQGALYVATRDRIFRLSLTSGAKLTDTAFHTGTNNLFTYQATNAFLAGLSAFDGKLYIWGTFDTYRGQARSAFIRVALDTGEPDAAYAFNASFRVQAVISDGAGGAYVSGSLRSAPMAAADRLLRLDANGVAMPAFKGWAGPSALPIASMALVGDRLYIAGDFGSVGGKAAQPVMRYDFATQRFDPSFVAAIERSAGTASVRAVAIRGQALYIGGDFDTVSTQPRKAFAKLDAASGALDAAFDAGLSGPPPSGITAVNSIVLDESALFVGGSFSSVRGPSGSRTVRAIAKLDPTSGVSLTAFAPAFSDDGSRTQAAMLHGGALLLGGFYPPVSSGNINSFYRLDPSSGAVLTSLHNHQTTLNAFALGTGIDDELSLNCVYSIEGGNPTDPSYRTINSETGAYYVAGEFGELKLDGSAHAVLFTLGSRYIGGSFRSFNSLSESYSSAVPPLFRLSGFRPDAAFAPELPSGASSVRVLAIVDGLLFTGGSFGASFLDPLSGAQVR